MNVGESGGLIHSGTWENSLGRNRLLAHYLQLANEQLKLCSIIYMIH